MFKYKYGPITNTKTGESKYIVVTPFASENVMGMVLGFGISALIMAILTFKSGADVYEAAELKTLEDLGLVKYK